MWVDCCWSKRIAPRAFRFPRELVPEAAISIGRDGRTSFEAAFRITLGADVVYMNSGGAISINGDETFTLSWEGSVIVAPPFLWMPSTTTSGWNGACGRCCVLDWTKRCILGGNPRIRWRNPRHLHLGVLRRPEVSFIEFVEIHVASGRLTTPRLHPGHLRPGASDFPSFCGGCHTGNGSGGIQYWWIRYRCAYTDGKLSSTTSRVTKGVLRILTEHALGGPFGGTDEDIALILQWIEDGQLGPEAP